MAWGTAVTIVGNGLEFVGAAVAGRGVAQTWSEFSNTDERFLAPVADWFKSVAAAGSEAVHKIISVFTKKRGQAVYLQAAGEAMTVSGFAQLSRSYTALGPEMTTRAALEQLDTRTRELLMRLDEHQDALGKRDARIADLERRLAAQADELKQRDRQLAIGGIRLQTIGLALVAAGAALQAVGAGIGD